MSNDYHLAGWCWRFNWPCCALKRWTYTNKVVSLSLSVCLGAGMFIGTFILHVQWHGGKWTNLNGKQIFKHLIFIFLFHLLHHFNFEYTWNPIRCTYTKWREPLSIESVNQRLGFVQSKWICHQFQKMLNTFHLDVWLGKNPLQISNIHSSNPFIIASRALIWIFLRNFIHRFRLVFVFSSLTQ